MLAELTPGARRRRLIPVKPRAAPALHRALEQRREVLVQELGGDEVRLREGGGDMEQADLSRDQDELREIDAARQRLADGSYGVCTDCGVEIGFERLHAEPEAARCIDCQRRRTHTTRTCRSRCVTRSTPHAAGWKTTRGSSAATSRSLRS